MMKGLCVSKGNASGRVVIVDRSFSRQELFQSSILVMKTLDRNLLINLNVNNVVGIIAEVGNIGSHGAGILRHLHIPCIVRIRDATSILKNGDQIVLNGTKGTIDFENAPFVEENLHEKHNWGNFYRSITMADFSQKNIETNTDWYCARPDRPYQKLRFDIIRNAFVGSAAYLFNLPIGEIRQNNDRAIEVIGFPNNIDICRFVLCNPQWLIDKAKERSLIINDIRIELRRLLQHEKSLDGYFQIFLKGAELYRKLFLYSLMSQAISDELLDAYVDFVSMLLNTNYSRDILELHSVYVQNCLDSGIDPGVSQKWKIEKAYPHIWEGYITFERLNEDSTISAAILSKKDASLLKRDYDSFRTIVPLVYQLSEEFFYTSSSINSFINWSLVQLCYEYNKITGSAISVDEIYEWSMEELFFNIGKVKGVDVMKDYSFMSAFNPADNLVKEYDNWVILLREGQNTLGDCIFVLKREVSSFGEMLPEESAELAIAMNWYETKCKDLFGAEKFNYIAAMMRDNFVHFHAFPRYSSQKEMYGCVWKDERWPRVIQFGPVSHSKDILARIRDDLKK